MLLGTRVLSGGGGIPYLESVGGAWINTGLTADSTMYGVTVTFELISNADNNIAIFGWWYTGGYASRIYWRGASDCFYFQHPTNTATPFSQPHIFTGVHTAQVGRGFVALDDEQIQVPARGVRIGNSTQPLFGSKAFSRASDIGSKHELLSGDDILRVYSAKWIHNKDGTPAMELKPSKDSSGEPCMFDEVSGRYFYNQGSGHFNFGIS